MSRHICGAARALGGLIMSRRLKKSRTVKLTSTANLPRLDSDGLDLHFARTFARKRPSLRTSLMGGTAVGMGFLGTVMVNTQPAMATCSLNGTTITCTGTDAAGIGPYFAPGVQTINIVADTVGQNGVG